MKIWLNTAASVQFNNYECDCSGECFNDIGELSRIELPLFEEDLQQIRIGELKQVTPLHVQECMQDRWLVCNPTGSGRIAVLDRLTHILFEQFQTPKPLRVVMLEFKDASQESIEVAVALFYKAGLLQQSNQPFLELEHGKAKSLSAWLHVTNACNLRCHYCYLEKTSERMAQNTARYAVDAIFRSAKKHHFKHVSLKYAGGEASLHMANVIAIHDYATQLARQQEIILQGSILSNGVVLSQHAIEQLKERHIGVTISLDGIGEYHDSQRPFLRGRGSFQYVDRTIKQLLANGLVPHISVTVTHRNLVGLIDVIEYILERDMGFTLNYYRDNDFVIGDDLQFSEQQMIATMRSVFALLERKLPKRSLLGSLIDKSNLYSPHKRTCAVGQSYLVINQHGGIAKCHGDIQRTVTNIYDDDPLQLIKDDLNGVQGLSVEEKEGCRTCDWRYWCTGGCPLQTYRMTGRYDVKSPNCNIYTALFPEALRLEALHLLKDTTPIIV